MPIASLSTPYGEYTLPSAQQQLTSRSAHALIASQSASAQTLVRVLATALGRVLARA